MNERRAFIDSPGPIVFTSGYGSKHPQGLISMFPALCGFMAEMTSSWKKSWGNVVTRGADVGVHVERILFTLCFREVAFIRKAVFSMSVFSTFVCLCSSASQVLNTDTEMDG